MHLLQFRFLYIIFYYNDIRSIILVFIAFSLRIHTHESEWMIWFMMIDLENEMNNIIAGEMWLVFFFFALFILPHILLLLFFDTHSNDLSLNCTHVSPLSFTFVFVVVVAYILTLFLGSGSISRRKFVTIRPWTSCINLLILI